MTLQVMLQQLSTASVAELFNITACRKLPLGIPVLSQSFGSCRCVVRADPKVATRLQCYGSQACDSVAVLGLSMLSLSGTSPDFAPAAKSVSAQNNSISEATPNVNLLHTMPPALD